jgi:hypothetical protein
MDDTTSIDLPPTECALVTHDDMESLEFRFPNPEHRDLENDSVPVPRLMAYLAACYYRYNRDPEFVRQQMDWCKANLQHTLGRDIEDRLASDDTGDDGNGGYNGGNGYRNGNGGNGYRNGNGYANGYSHDNGNGNGFRY